MILIRFLKILFNILKPTKQPINANVEPLEESKISAGQSSSKSKKNTNLKEMKKVKLNRKKLITNSKNDSPVCILGKLESDGKEIAATLENPWLDNLQGISCIPSGQYKCVKDNTGKFQWWKILDVEGRQDIEIHQGNYAKDTRGCIIIGQDWAWEGEEPKVINSTATLKKLQKILSDEFIIEIKES